MNFKYNKLGTVLRKVLCHCQQVLKYFYQKVQVNQSLTLVKLGHLPYFIEYSVHTSIQAFILQFYLNTLFMNKVSECYLARIVRMQYFSIIFNEKVHTVLDKIWEIVLKTFWSKSLKLGNCNNHSRQNILFMNETKWYKIHLTERLS